jgi:hypothetical protein
MKRAFLLALLVASTTASAWSWHRQFHVEGIAQHRDLNQSGFLARAEQWEGFGLADFALEGSSENFFVEVKPQLRSVQSPGTESSGPGQILPGFTSRWLHSQRVIKRQADRETQADFDRLNVRWTTQLAGGDVELYAGRRPISLGVLRFFPVWNKLTLPLLFQPGPEWINNPDGLGARWQGENRSLRLIDVQGEDPKHDRISLAEGKASFGKAEVQLLVGEWWRRTTFGLASTLDAWEATFRFEALWYGEDPTEPKGEASAAQTQWAVGAERALNAKWTAAVEYYQQSLCHSQAQGYGLTTLSRLQVLNGCRYLFPYVDYQLGGFWRVGAGGLLQLADGSTVAVVAANYSWTDNLGAEFKLKQASGPNGSEFGSKRVQDPFGRSLGAQSTADLTLSWTY